MAAKKNKPKGAPESAAALAAAMNENQIPARGDGDTIKTTAEAPPEEAPRKRGRKAKQDDLPAMTGPGVEKKRIPEIEAAADDYVDLRDRRIALGIEEKKAKETLISVMHVADVKIYDYDGKIVTLSPKDCTETVKVKVKDDVAVEDAEGESDE